MGRDGWLLYLKIFVPTIPFIMLLTIMTNGFGIAVLLLASHYIFNSVRDHCQAVKAIDPNADINTAHHTQEIEIDLSYEKTFDLCKRALVLSDCRIRKEKCSKGIIRAKKGRWPSWVHDILIKVQKHRGDRTHVSVSSKPFWTFRLTLDYGRNLKNVTDITNFLRKSTISWDVRDV